MSEIKYPLDEHVDPHLKRALKKNWPDMVVWRVGDAGAPPLRSSDPDILIWCEANSFSLVTNNRASMLVHLRDHLDVGRHIPGIFVLSPKMKMGETAQELALIWGASEMEEYLDLLNHLPLSS